MVFVTIDPGSGVSSKAVGKNVVFDQWGFCVNAVPITGEWLILELWAEHLDDAQFIDRLFRVADQYSPYLIGIERMPHLENYLQLSFQTRKRTLPIVTLKSGNRSKEFRIRGLMPLLERMYFNDRQVAAIQQRLRLWYPGQRHHDDDLDALAYQIDIAHPPTVEQLAQQKRYHQEYEDTRRFQLLSPLEQAEWKKWKELEKFPTGTILQELEEIYGEG